MIFWKRCFIRMNICFCTIVVSTIIVLVGLLSGCSVPWQEPPVELEVRQRFQTDFIGAFDVRIIMIGYEESEEEFTRKAQIVYDKSLELHKLYDIYHDYEGIANIKTINDNAGIAPVAVDRQIIDLILFSKEAYERTDGLTNIAMGSVLRIWHDYRTRGNSNPQEAQLPGTEELQAAAAHTNIEDVIVDEENGTVFLADPEMRLDVGAIAKGYATEVAKNAAVAGGLDSAIISAGGNVVTVGSPKDGTRVRWGIGIQDPFKTVEGVTNLVDTVFVTDKAVVSSGGYERFYIVDGVTYHHIIDPETLFPAEQFADVSVVHEDSGVADYLSTALFIATYEQGLEIAQAHGAEVLWVYPDGEMKATEGYERISKLFSEYSAVD